MANPFDIDLATSDDTWPLPGEPFRVVLVFKNDANADQYNAFQEAWLIYNTKDDGGCHHSKWPMIRAQKRKGAGGDFNRIIVYLQPVPVPGDTGSRGGRPGTGSGTVYGSSATPPPAGTVTQCTPITNL
jgi:hypothetical protein